jgi:hypothetical protein
MAPIPHSALSFNAVTVQWSRPSSHGDPVTAYDIQYRVVGEPRWAKAVNGLSAVVSEGIREVQTISTRTDVGFPITSGTFTLAYNMEVGFACVRLCTSI